MSASESNIDLSNLRVAIHTYLLGNHTSERFFKEIEDAITNKKIPEDKIFWDNKYFVDWIEAKSEYYDSNNPQTESDRRYVKVRHLVSEYYQLPVVNDSQESYGKEIIQEKEDPAELTSSEKVPLQEESNSNTMRQSSLGFLGAASCALGGSLGLAGIAAGATLAATGMINPFIGLGIAIAGAAIVASALSVMVWKCLKRTSQTQQKPSTLSISQFSFLGSSQTEERLPLVKSSESVSSGDECDDNQEFNSERPSLSDGYESASSWSESEIVDEHGGIKLIS